MAKVFSRFRYEYHNAGFKAFGIMACCEDVVEYLRYYYEHDFWEVHDVDFADFVFAGSFVSE